MEGVVLLKLTYLEYLTMNNCQPSKDMEAFLRHFYLTLGIEDVHLGMDKTPKQCVDITVFP